MPTSEIIARFESRVDRLSDDQCWPWLGSVVKHGRGIFWNGQRNVAAPRFAYLLAKGEEPADGLFVCHACDNPNCVNPAHLWLGSPRDNAVDCVRKGRNRPHRRSQTTCTRGHSYLPDNVTYTAKGQRICRKCNVAKVHASRKGMTIDEVLRERGQL